MSQVNCKIKFVISRDGKTKGTIISEHARSCTMEGCRHMRASVRWPDGSLTYPCWGGMDTISDDTVKII